MINSSGRGRTSDVTIPGLGCSRTLVVAAAGFLTLSAVSGAVAQVGADSTQSWLLVLLAFPALLAGVGAYRRSNASGFWAIAAGLALTGWTLVSNGLETTAEVAFYLLLAMTLIFGGFGLRRNRFASCAVPSAP